LFGVYGRQKRKFSKQAEKHENEQKKLLYMHTLELDSAEKEIMRLKNEKLEAEVQHKTTELASTAMHLVKKGELLTKIKEELTKLKKRSADLKELEEVKKLLKILQEEDKMDEDWEHFAFHFDKVHADFLRELKNKYPKLSPNELKLCAYLRMNLSSKEIAQLMNISVRGVEISRYRLRKKFELPTEVSLFDFLIGNNNDGNITITQNKTAEKLS
jgi:DNA-binding CsgD family transcriptional regulator